MRNSLIVGDLRSPSIVHGVHGTSGTSRWKCFVRGSELVGDWEAVEWAELPPGGISGEHVHTRTEEVYFILAGRGVIMLDGRGTDVSAGDVILTGLGTRHGLRNVGDVNLSWLVIEISSPATAAAYSSGTDGSGGTDGNEDAEVLHT